MFFETFRRHSERLSWDLFFCVIKVHLKNDINNLLKKVIVFEDDKDAYAGIIFYCTEDAQAE